MTCLHLNVTGTTDGEHYATTKKKSAGSGGYTPDVISSCAKLSNISHAERNSPNFLVSFLQVPQLLLAAISFSPDECKCVALKNLKEKRGNAPRLETFPVFDTNETRERQISHEI
jgi:hypothetical protein